MKASSLSLALGGDRALGGGRALGLPRRLPLGPSARRPSSSSPSPSSSSSPHPPLARSLRWGSSMSPKSQPSLAPGTVTRRFESTLRGAGGCVRSLHIATSLSFATSSGHDIPVWFLSPALSGALQLGHTRRQQSILPWCGPPTQVHPLANTPAPCDKKISSFLRICMACMH